MPRLQPNEMLMPSVLDRLIDPDSGGTLARRGYPIERMVEAVRRDLEDLLNTRRTNPKIAAEFVEVLASIEAYGIPDLATVNAYTSRQREEIGHVIEQVVLQFEPRLRDVRATLLPPKFPNEPTVRFHVDARLALDPAPEVAFETILELTTGHASIHSSEA